MNTLKNGFTLIEVAVAGSLIGLCVLTALSIIPAGLRTQDEARMRAVAAAVVMTQSATVGVRAASMFVTASPAIAVWDGRGVVKPPPSAGGTGFRAPGSGAPGALENRLIFTVTSGSSASQPTGIQAGTFKVITAWLLNKNPDTGNAPFRATYLATFTDGML